MKLVFEWDENKARLNLRNHRVSFDEARTVFNNPLQISFRDESHSEHEERLISIGTSARSRVLLVVHTEQSHSGDTCLIRMISARRATALERKVYEKSQS